MDTKILPEDLFGTFSSSNKGGKGQKSKSAPRSKKKPTLSGASRKESKAKSSATAGKSTAKPGTGEKNAARRPSGGTGAARKRKTATGESQPKKKKPPAPSGRKTAAEAAEPESGAQKPETETSERKQGLKEREKKETGTRGEVKKTAPDLKLRGEFPWEHPDREEPRVPCPACKEPVYPDSTVCIHCGAMYMECPHCREHAAVLYNPKMATEQRLNKIFKQYTLFSIALPSMPMQDIMDCSNCRKHVILCEACRHPMKVNKEKCPECGRYVRKTKLLMNPLAVFEALFRKPDLSKSVQRAIEDLLRSLSEW